MNNSDYESESSESSIDLDLPRQGPATNRLLSLGPASPSDKLHIAASKGQQDKVKELLAVGAVCQPDALGYSPLHRAAAAGHVEIIKLLVATRCCLDLQDLMHGNTALHEASWNGFSQTVQTLINSGANIQLQNKGGFSALHMSAQNGHNQCTRYLIYAGCNPVLKNSYGDTALHTAARYGHAGVAQILTNSCSNVVNEPNKNGDIALHIASALKRRKITCLLLDGNVNLNYRNKQGELAMDIALRKGHIEIVQMLHEHANNYSQPLAGNRMTNLDLKPTEESKVVEQKAKKKKLSSFFKKKKSKVKDQESDESKIKSGSKQEPLTSRNAAMDAAMAQQLVTGFQQFRQHQQQPPLLQQQHRQQSQQLQFQPQELLQHNRPMHQQKLRRQLKAHDDSWLGMQSTAMMPQGYMGVQYYRDLAGNIHQEPAVIQQAPCPCNFHHPPIGDVSNQYPINRSEDSACSNQPVRLYKEVPQAFMQHRLHSSSKYEQANDYVIGVDPSEEIGPHVMMPVSPGRIYRSKSDETLSHVSSFRYHISKPLHHITVDSDDSICCDGDRKGHELQTRHQSHKDYHLVVDRSANRLAEGRSNQLGKDQSNNREDRLTNRLAEGCSANDLVEEVRENEMLMVPANVRDWFTRQDRAPAPHLSRTDHNRQSMFVSRTRFTQVHDL